MKLFTLLLPLAVVAQAQTFRFNDGRTASAPIATVRGGDVQVDVSPAGDGSVQITYAASRIVAMEWPAPAALAEARAALAAGRAEEAVKKIDAIVGAQEPFRLVPGSWWAEAASLRAQALAGAGRSIDVEVALVRLRQAKASPTWLVPAESAFIKLLVADGRTDQARERLNKLRGEASDDRSLAGLAVIEGDLLLGTGETEAALLAYLRVPVYHSEERGTLRLALRGAVTCLEKLGDTARAAQLSADLAKIPARDA